jgi:hypothetical protein
LKNERKKLKFALKTRRKKDMPSEKLKARKEGEMNAILNLPPRMN